MKNGSDRSKILDLIMPVMAACLILALVLMTVPSTFTPAKVMGGYTSIGAVGFTAPDVISLSAPGDIVITVSGFDVNNLNMSSITFAGAPVESWVLNADGTITLYFSKLKAILSTNDTSVNISGTLKDGTPFGGAVPVSIIG